MSVRGSDSGSQSLASSRKDTVEYEDVTPGESARQVESSVSRASRVARRAAAEVRARTARQRAAKELQIAAMREEIVEMEAEGEKEALDVGDEAFQRELRNIDSLSRRSAPESRGVRSWAPDGQMRRVQVEETRTSCMVVCGPTGSNVAPGSSNQSLIPRKLFGDGEDGSQATVAEGSHVVRPEENPEPPCATKDTEEGRRNRTKAWVTETATQDVGWKGNREPEVTYQDQDVRLREPERANSHVPPASRRGSEASNASRMIKRSPGQESRERSGVAGSSLASRRRSVLSVDLHPRKRPSEASETIEGSLISRRRSGESADVRSSRRSRITSPQKEKIDTAYRRWEEPSFTRRSRRKSSPVPQEEMSLTDYADLPPTTRYGRESDREDPYVRTRVRIEPPLSPLRENTISKKNGASRYSMETPCIHVDPHRATRSHYDSHRAAEFEAPLRTPLANSYRDENSPRHPNTRVQDTYAETSSVRSAR